MVSVWTCILIHIPGDTARPRFLRLSLRCGIKSTTNVESWRRGSRCRKKPLLVRGACYWTMCRLGFLWPSSQMINSLMRTNESSDSTFSPQQVSGTIFNTNRLRIKQNNISKIILQSLLAGMLVCFLGSNVLMDMRSTLPHNPITLAGSMSLLAGGELCEESKNQTESFEDFENRLKGFKSGLGGGLDGWKMDARKGTGGLALTLSRRQKWTDYEVYQMGC